MSLDQYLEMTDNDEQFLRATNAGEYPRSIWQGSTISKKAKKKPDLHIKEKCDDSIDYQPEEEDILPEHVSLEEALPDEFSYEDIPEDID